MADPWDEPSTLFNDIPPENMLNDVGYDFVKLDKWWASEESPYILIFSEIEIEVAIDNILDYFIEYDDRGLRIEADAIRHVNGERQDGL